MNYSTDLELDLLETLYASHAEGLSPSQRDLAGAAGLSLGMTNALLRRFAERGWVKFSSLRGRHLQYGLTPDGVAEVARRSVAYFARAARNASRYRSRIDHFVREARERGYLELVLEGPAELDFLFEYSCMRHGIAFRKAAGSEAGDLACAEVDPAAVVRVRMARQAGATALDPEDRKQGCRDVLFADIIMRTELL